MSNTKQQARKLVEARVIVSRMTEHCKRHGVIQNLTRICDGNFNAVMSQEEMITVSLQLANEVVIALNVMDKTVLVTFWEGLSRADMKTLVSAAVLQTLMRKHMEDAEKHATKA